LKSQANAALMHPAITEVSLFPALSYCLSLKLIFWKYT